MRRFLHPAVVWAASALVWLASSSWPVAAQDKFPSRAIRIVSPFPAGAVSDISLRLLAGRLEPRLGTQIVIENQPTGGGVAAAKAVLASPPDGTS